MLAPVAVIVAILAWVGIQLPLDYWDGYDFLSNARYLSGADITHLQVGYETVRPPMVALLLAPMLWGYKAAGEGTSLVGIHLLMVAVAAGGAWLMYQLFKRSLGEIWAAVGVLLLVLNPLFLHYSPFAMADVPSMVFVTLALLAHLRARDTGRSRDYAVLAIGLACLFLTKYPTSLLGLTLVLFEAVMVFIPTGPPPAPSISRRLLALLTNFRLLIAFSASLVLFYLVHVGVYAVAFKGSVDPWTQLLPVLKQGLVSAGASHTDPRDEYVLGMVRMSSAPLVVVGGLGLLRALLRRKPEDVLHVLWFTVFFGLMTFKVVHKEARYLLPMLPSLLYLQALGLQQLFEAITSPARKRLGVGLAVVVGLLVLPITLGTRELQRFWDPVYSKPFMAAMARWTLDRLKPDEPIVLLSARTFSVYPRDPVWLVEDEFFYFHTLNHQATNYFFDRQVRSPVIVPDPNIGASTVVPATPFRLYLTTRPENVAKLTGDAMRIELFPKNGVLWSSSITDANTDVAAQLPEPPLPVQLEFVERRTYEKVGAPADGVQRYAWAADPTQAIELDNRQGRWDAKSAPAGFRLFGRPSRHELAEPLADSPVAQPPEVLELMKTEVAEFRFR